MNYGMWYCRAQLYSHIHNPYASVDELAASGIVLQNSSFLSLSFISNFLRAEWRFGPWTFEPIIFCRSLSPSSSEWQQTLIHTDWRMHLLRNSGLFLDLSFLALQSMKFCSTVCPQKTSSVISAQMEVKAIDFGSHPICIMGCCSMCVVLN